MHSRPRSVHTTPSNDLISMQLPRQPGHLLPLRRLRHARPHPSPLRPPLCRLHVRHRRVVSAGRTSVDRAWRVRHLLGVHPRRRRERGVQSVSEEPRGAMPADAGVPQCHSLRIRDYYYWKDPASAAGHAAVDCVQCASDAVG